MKDIYSAFTGSIPQNYDRYLGPMFFHLCAEDLAGRMVDSSAKQVLEIAAGTGIASRYIRNQLHENAHMTVSDLNADMLAHAEQKFSADENVVFSVADAMLLPFENNQFDVIACQFGIMFCPDKVQVFREARRVLAEKGRLLFSVWDSLQYNPLPHTVNKILADIFEDNVPAFLHAPFSYYDQSQIRNDMQQAGFTDIEFITLNGECVYADPHHAAMGMVTGSPLMLEIEQRADTSIDDVVENISSGLQAAFGASDCRVPIRWTVISATS